MLSCRVAPRCARVKHQFCDKMMVSTWTVFKLLLSEQNGRNEQRKNNKNGTFTTTHLCLAVFCVAFGHLYESVLIIKALKEEG